jgi:hypothetical protein
MSAQSLVFLKLPKRRRVTDDALLLRSADLAVFGWQREYRDMGQSEESAEVLWTWLGAEVLGAHTDSRGILVAPGMLAPVQAEVYDAAVAAYSLAGVWLPNIAREPSAMLVAGDEAEIPLLRYPKSRRIEFYVVKTLRAMQELELQQPPFRTVRLELLARATPRQVSAFYLPQLKALGLQVKRRIWRSGVAERVLGSNASTVAVVHSEQRWAGSSDCFIQVSWVQKH